MKAWIVSAAAALFLAPGAFAADGKALFEDNGCAACHHPTKDTVGPPLAEIAAKYAGRKGALVMFLEGTGRAVVEPEKFALMAPNLTATKALSKEERGALADFLLGRKAKGRK